MGGCGVHDDRRGAQLWRTGGDDASGWRTVCLSARSARTAVGVSLRLDIVSCDSDRDDCRGGRGFRQVPRSFLSRDLFFELDSASLEGSADSPRADGTGEHGCGNQHAESGRHPARSFSFGGEHLRSENRSAYPECVYHGQGLGAAGVGVVRPGARTECAGAGCELQRTFLAECRAGRAARRAGGGGWSGCDGGHADDFGRGASWVAVFRGRLEQRDFHGG